MPDDQLTISMRMGCNGRRAQLIQLCGGKSMHPDMRRRHVNIRRENRDQQEQKPPPRRRLHAVARHQQPAPAQQFAHAADQRCRPSARESTAA